MIEYLYIKWGYSKVRKILLIFLLLSQVLSLQINTSATSSSNEEFKVVAFVQPDSGAIGSTFNYFFASPYVQYRANDGSCVDRMFSAIVFSTLSPPATPSEAESFIGQLTKENENIDAVNSAASVVKENGYADNDYKFPVYVKMPYVANMFEFESEVVEFCEYFINSLVNVCKSQNYENAILQGIYFDEQECKDSWFKSQCEKLCDKYELKALSYDTMSHLNVGGVPQVEDDTVATALKNDYNQLFKNGLTSDVGVHFDAYNTLYECAMGVSEPPENPNAREVYDILYDISKGTLEDASADTTKEGQGTASGVEYAVYAFIASIGAACGIYLLVKCIRKAFAK